MQQLCAHVAVCRGWDLRPQHEDGGEGGGRHPGDHHTNRGRQRHRAEAIQILPTALGWWLPSFWKNSNFIFLHLQRRAEDPTEAVSRGWNRRPFWTSSAELLQSLALNSFLFCSKIKAPWKLLQTRVRTDYRYMCTVGQTASLVSGCYVSVCTTLSLCRPMRVEQRLSEPIG